MTSCSRCHWIRGSSSWVLSAGGGGGEGEEKTHNYDSSREGDSDDEENSNNGLTGVVVDVVRPDDGVERLLPADRELISNTVSERQRLRLPEENTFTEYITKCFQTIVSVIKNEK